MNNDWMSNYAFNLFASELQVRTGKHVGRQLRHRIDVKDTRLICADCRLPLQALERAAAINDESRPSARVDGSRRNATTPNQLSALTTTSDRADGAHDRHP